MHRRSDAMASHNNPVSRRAFLRRLLIGCGLTAAAPPMFPVPAAGISQEREGGVSIEVSTVGYPMEASLGMTRGEVKAYLAHPSDGANLAGIIVIHDDLGLNDFVLATSRRAAAAGRLVLAPDLFSRVGGTERLLDPQARRTAAPQLDPLDVASDVQGAIAYLRSMNRLNGRIGVLGFGWGAEQALRAATIAAVQACVVLDGLTENRALIAGLRAPLLAMFASEGSDAPGIMEFERALSESNKTYEIRHYDGVEPSFYDDTNPQTYDAVGAQDAWERTTRHFDMHLRG